MFLPGDDASAEGVNPLTIKGYGERRWLEQNDAVALVGFCPKLGKRWVLYWCEVVRFSHPMGLMDLSCPPVPKPFKMKFSRNVEKLFLYSSSLFQIWIIFDPFKVIVDNLSQPLNCRANFNSFLRLSPQDAWRQNNCKTHGLSNLHQSAIYIWNLPENVVQIGEIVFEWAKRM
jgi:hypothetical protein